MASAGTFPGQSGSGGSPENNVFGAFGAVLGYIGAEAATILSFERLLWPQRFYSNFTLSSVLRLALLLPMGGPLHKAALKTLDVCFNHGLFKGPHEGHMLGTPFFRPLGWNYSMHDEDGGSKHTESLRNCLWARALTYLSIPANAAVPADGVSSNNSSGNTPSNSNANTPSGSSCSSSSSLEKAPPPLVRAKVMVSHLTLTRATAEDKNNPKLPFVSEGAGAPGLRVILAIIATELTGVLVCAALLAAYRTLWALFWVAPLALRLLSALFALRREPLVVLSASAAAMADPPRHFEVHCPQTEGNFMLITGPPALVLQFTRHYGHPLRDRVREVAQLAIIVAFGALFPLGLLCSVIWMPLPVQYTWLCYQIYVVLAMHVARYAHPGRGATTTEAHLAQHFNREVAPAATAGTRFPGPGAMGRGGGDERAVLFGHTRHGDGTVKATLVVTYHSRNQEGKDAMARLLQRPRCETPPEFQVVRSATTLTQLGSEP